VAKEVKLKRFNASQLYTPAVNMQLGTRYFRGMVDKFGGSFEYALAAYNAGSDRVDDGSPRENIAIHRSSWNRFPSPRRANTFRRFLGMPTL